MIFKKATIDLILSGKKAMTSRDKPQFEAGEIIHLMDNKDYSRISGKRIKITILNCKKLETFTDDDARKEGFKALC